MEAVGWLDVTSYAPLLPTEYLLNKMDLTKD